MSRGREAMEEAMLATPEMAATAAMLSEQQGRAAEQMRAAYGGPENGQGKIAPLSFLDSLSRGGQSVQARQGDA